MQIKSKDQIGSGSDHILSLIQSHAELDKCISTIYIRYTYLHISILLFSKHSTKSRAPIICLIFSSGTYAIYICNNHVIKSRVELNASRSESQLECAYANVLTYIV